MKTARNHLLDVDFLDLKNHAVKYDFISVLNVFSHLTNPSDTINEWKKLLKEGGELFLETGHSSHLPSKFHLKPYLLPDHLSFANKKIVTNLLGKAGFSILKIRIYRGTYYPAISPVRILKELAKQFLGRRNYFHSFFPKYRHGDMFVRVRKV